MPNSKEFIVTIVRFLSLGVFCICFSLWGSQLPGSKMPSMESMLIGWIIMLVIFLASPLLLLKRKDEHK